MRKLIALTLLSSLISCAPKQDKKVDTPKAAAVEVSDLPQITLIEQSGKQFSTSTLQGKSLLIFFGTSCEHCQREATQIQKYLKEFGEYSLYFISLDPYPLIQKFSVDYGLNNQPNVHFVMAEGSSVFNALGYIQTPTILLFNDHKKLVRRFDGETKIEEILKLL